MWDLPTRHHITAYNNLEVKVACVTKNQNFIYNNNNNNNNNNNVIYKQLFLN